MSTPLPFRIRWWCTNTTWQCNNCTCLNPNQRARQYIGAVCLEWSQWNLACNSGACLHFPNPLWRSAKLPRFCDLSTHMHPLTLSFASVSCEAPLWHHFCHCMLLRNLHAIDPWCYLLVLTPFVPLPRNTHIHTYTHTSLRTCSLCSSDHATTVMTSQNSQS